MTINCGHLLSNQKFLFSICLSLLAQSPPQNHLVLEVKLYIFGMYWPTRTNY